MSELADTELDLPEPAGPGEPFLLLIAADRWFGVPLPDVLEVVSARACTRLPGAPPHVLGLMNLRGRVVTVLDLAGALGLATGGAATGRVAVVDHAGTRVGLAVEDAPRILSIDPGTLTPGDGGENLPIASVTEADGRRLAVLDTGTMIGRVLA